MLKIFWASYYNSVQVFSDQIFLISVGMKVCKIHVNVAKSYIWYYHTNFNSEFYHHVGAIHKHEHKFVSSDFRGTCII